MKRSAVTPRPNWQDRLDKIGFYYHSIDGNYWQENACYVFNLAQVETIETATQILHEMYLQVASDVVRSGDYARLGIDDMTAGLIETSWWAQAPTLYGRFDLCYNGQGEPKLLEYNADTPTSLVEASVVQWYWLKEQQPNILPAHADQFNSIHERLLLQWKAIANHYSQAHTLDKKIANKLTTFTEKLPFAETLNQQINWYNFHLHLAAMGDSEEDFITCRYVQDTAIQAGLATHFVDIGDIGWDTEKRQFVDEKFAPIMHIFKLYPWEWLVKDEFGPSLPHSTTHWIEPAWKLLLSNKALLPLLWQTFPNHPNLLPAYFEQDKHKLGQSYVKKPFFSREGANVTLMNGNSVLDTRGEYGAEGFVYQACQPLPQFINQLGQPMYTLVGSWIVGHNAAGMGIREDYSLITKDTSLFVPHIFLD